MFPEAAPAAGAPDESAGSGVIVCIGAGAEYATGVGAADTSNAAESVIGLLACCSWQPAAINRETTIAGIAYFTTCSLLEKVDKRPFPARNIPPFIGRAAVITLISAPGVYDPIMVHRIVILALVMSAIGIALCALMILLMARMLLRPRRMTDPRAMILLHRLTPADLGMEFENISYTVLDQSTGKPLRIAGWWIPTPDSRGRCAVILHGYSDAKVGGIAWAPLLRSFGFNILAIDLRAHGESGGVYSCAGFWERYDVNQVLDQTKSARPAETRQILLFGISLGAATAAATAVMRNDLRAVILEGPFADFHTAAALHADRLGTPGPFFQDNAYRLAKWLSHADFDAVRPVDTIPKIPCPLLVIQSGDDPFLTESDHSAIRQAVESRDPTLGPSVNWELPGVHHVVGMLLDPVGYHRRIEEFLAGVLQNMGEVCDK